MYLDYNNDNILRIDKQNYNIGINLQSEPTEKLEVNGNIKATSFIGIGSNITDINADNIARYY